VAARERSLTRRRARSLLPFMGPSVSNPYQAPAEPEPLPEEEQVALVDDGSATRSARLGASLIDAFISLVIVVPFQVYGGMYDGFPHVKRPEFPHSLLWSLGGAAVWLALHAVFLARSAQTIGKKLVGIQMVNVSDGRPASFYKLVVWRFLPATLAYQIPYVGSVLALADIGFIFRKDRRCLHDHVAGTRVVEVPKGTS
jgi:uncharacterized RDD family membrane protein YckC